MKIAAHTLGCKLNFAETSDIMRRFTLAGWEQVDFNEAADLFIINTCTVTAIAEKKCRNAIRQAIACNPEAIVAVIGCFAQNAAAEIAKIEGVDIILGNDRKHDLLRYVEAFMKERGGDNQPAAQKDRDYPFNIAYSHTDRTRTFFKIQDGCARPFAQCKHCRHHSRSA